MNVFDELKLMIWRAEVHNCLLKEIFDMLPAYYKKLPNDMVKRLIDCNDRYIQTLRVETPIENNPKEQNHDLEDKEEYNLPF